MNTTATTKSNDRFTRAARVNSDDAVASAAISGGKLLLTFSKTVVARGIPLGVTVNAVAPTAVAQPSSTTLLLTYAVPVAAGQTWAIANKEPGIRTANGGFVAAAGDTF